MKLDRQFVRRARRRAPGSGIVRVAAAAGVIFAAACDNGVTAAASTVTITPNPCGAAGTISLAVATTTNVDCSAGGTTVTLAGNGANYLIVPQFPSDQAADSYVPYQLFTGSVATAAASANRIAAVRARFAAAGGSSAAVLPRGRNLRAQRAAEHAMLKRGATRSRSALVSASFARQAAAAAISRAVTPPVGSTRTFHVASSFTSDTWATVTASLAYAGPNVLVYVDNAAPANGFTPAALSAFGQLVDQTFYPIDTAAFGPPSDIDGNGHVIMLMSPVVNADTPTATCNASGYVAGFFDTGDFDGPLDPNSNQGEIFYSIVPDPAGQFSCAHTVADLGLDVPSTFMHELQHLINFSQHVVVSGGAPSSSWLDEGMSIVAEELGSLYYENKCPPPQCRTNPSQIFPDSSQGFIQDFLYDSYAYAFLPDTATITLSSDDEDGFSWRGGAWLFARWLGDQNGATVYRQLERGPSNALTDVQSVTGQPFPQLFSNFGVALYADSLPGLPRNTAPPANRFVTRNLRQLWARLFATSASNAVPYANPLTLFQITADSSTAVMLPGTMSFYYIDTPVGTPTVTIRFSAPDGTALASVLHPQIAIFRLPPGL